MYNRDLLSLCFIVLFKVLKLLARDGELFSWSSMRLDYFRKLFPPNSLFQWYNTSEMPYLNRIHCRIFLPLTILTSMSFSSWFWYSSWNSFINSLSLSWFSEKDCKKEVHKRDLLCFSSRIITAMYLCITRTARLKKWDLKSPSKFDFTYLIFPYFPYSSLWAFVFFLRYRANK